MTIGLLNPIAAAAEDDYATIGGQKTPGLLRIVSGFARKTTYQKKPGRGQKGTTNTVIGQPESEGVLEFVAWTSAQMVAWDALQPLLSFATDTAPATGLGIYHPRLSDVGVVSLAVPVDEFGPWMHKGPGEWTRTLKVHSFEPKKPQPVISTPVASIGNPKPIGVPVNPVLAAQQAKIVALTARLAAGRTP